MAATLIPLQKRDLPFLQKIGMETFFATFAPFNSSTDLQGYLHSAFTIDKLLTEFNNPSSQFFMLDVDGELAGYLKLNIADAQTEEHSQEYLEIQRIYIKPSFQHRAIGHALALVATEMAQKLGKKKIWLGVWERNHPALNFYRSLGFQKVATHNFFIGPNPQTDYIMEKEL